jgi:Zn ribbon nucleic-acid-binding protein
MAKCPSCLKGELKYNQMMSHDNGLGEVVCCVKCGNRINNLESYMEILAEDMHEYEVLGVKLGMVWETEDIDDYIIVKFWEPNEACLKHMPSEACQPFEGLPGKYVQAHMNFEKNQLELVDMEGEVIKGFETDLMTFLLKVRQEQINE